MLYLKPNNFLESREKRFSMKNKFLSAENI